MAVTHSTPGEDEKCTHARAHTHMYIFKKAFLRPQSRSMLCAKLQSMWLEIFMAQKTPYHNTTQRHKPDHDLNLKKPVWKRCVLGTRV